MSDYIYNSFVQYHAEHLPTTARVTSTVFECMGVDLAVACTFVWHRRVGGAGDVPRPGHHVAVRVVPLLPHGQGQGSAQQAREGEESSMVAWMKL